MNIRKNIIYTIGITIFLINSCLQQPNSVSDPDDIVIYPAPPAKTRIQYLTSFSSSTQFKGGQSAVNRFLYGEETPLPIVKPYGISVRESKIYICDTGIRGIIILDLENNSFEYFIPKGKGQLQLPLNCDLDNVGNLYIADGNRKQVIIFDKDLKYVDAISLSGDSKPTDVYVDSLTIWISAIDNHKIYAYNRSTLKYKGSFPDSDQNSADYLYQPSNLGGTGDKIYVTDIGNCTVKVFDTDNSLVNSFGGPGRGYGQFTRPKGITADNEGNIYVVDAAFENVQIFNSDGNLLLNFGGTYNGPGGMSLPADITIDYNNFQYFQEYLDPAFKLEYLIYVTNQYGPDKVSVYGFIGLTE